jgi:hypothetical protein
MQELSRDGETVTITKPELRAAVDAIDQFFHDNAAAINNTLPQPARANLTTAQKSRLLRIILKYRYDNGA